MAIRRNHANAQDAKRVVLAFQPYHRTTEAFLFKTFPTTTHTT
jgi:hypothetical protein